MHADNTFDLTDSCVRQLLRVCDVTHACVGDMTHACTWHVVSCKWRDSSMRVTWLIHTCDMPLLMHMCDMSPSHLWPASFSCVTCLIHLCVMTHHCVYHMTHLRLWHVSFVCVTWMIHAWHMTHPCVWRDSCMVVTRCTKKKISASVGEKKPGKA